MNENYKIAKNSFILYVRLIITTITGLIATRVTLQQLGVNDFGLYNIIGGVVSLMSFLNTVMISTTYRFIAYELGKVNSKGVNQIFNISFVIHFSLAILLIILAETIGRYYILNLLNVEHSKTWTALFVFRFSIIAVVFSILSVPFQGLITANENFLIRSSIEIVRSFLKLGAVFALIFYNGDKLKLFSVLMCGVMFIPAFFFAIYCKKAYPEITTFKVQSKWSKYKEFLSFTGWTLLGAGARVGKTQGSAIIINKFFGAALNASFGIAGQVNSLVTLIYQNINQAAMPQITKNLSGGDKNRSKKLTIYISKYSFYLVLIPTLPILLETTYLLKIWLGSIPEYSVIFVRLLLIYALIESMNAGIPAFIQATGKIKWFQIINSTILLLCLPISYFFYQKGYEPYYILIIYIFGLILLKIMRFILLKVLLSFKLNQFVKMVYSRIIIVLLLVSPLFFVLDFFNEGLSRFILTVILSVIYVLIIIFLVGLEKNERIFIKQTSLKFFKIKNG